MSLYSRADGWGSAVGHSALWQHRGSPAFEPCGAPTSSLCTSPDSCTTQWVHKSLFPLWYLAHIHDINIYVHCLTWKVGSNLKLGSLSSCAVGGLPSFIINLNPLNRISSPVSQTYMPYNICLVNSDTGNLTSMWSLLLVCFKGFHPGKTPHCNLYLYYLGRLWLLSTDLPMQNEVRVMLNPYDNDSRCIPPSFITTLSLTPLASHVL